jgi:hypothetical protein
MPSIDSDASISRFHSVDYNSFLNNQESSTRPAFIHYSRSRCTGRLFCFCRWGRKIKQRCTTKLHNQQNTITVINILLAINRSADRHFGQYAVYRECTQSTFDPFEEVLFLVAGGRPSSSSNDPLVEAALSSYIK